MSTTKRRTPEAKVTAPSKKHKKVDDDDKDSTLVLVICVGNDFDTQGAIAVKYKGPVKALFEAHQHKQYLHFNSEEDVMDDDRMQTVLEYIETDSNRIQLSTLQQFSFARVLDINLEH